MGARRERLRYRQGATPPPGTRPPTTRAGLAAYLFTTDASHARRISEALQYGMVGLNTGLVSTEVAPFGGVKESGIGREGSKYGLDEFLDLKLVCEGI